ncbi:MAG: hypothetical protein EA424_14785 [Planctomycetaceae bacterium]|nr:MAG: hypothetical protein EA424_14785 [Planctomycetaceae bacterium]
MRNPLSMFRRHQKVLLVVFGVVIVITFTIGGSIEYYQSARMPTGQDTDVVVTWKHGRFRDDDLMMMRNLHNLTVRFLDTLVMQAVEAGGVPSAPGLTRDQMTGQIRDPGIPRSYAEEDLVQTAVLARRAEELGVVVSDQAIVEFLDGLAAGKVPRTEFAGLLRQATGGRLIQLQLFEQLRKELQAQNLRMMANSGLFAITPVSAWNYFNRLDRRVETEMLPLPVEDFLDQVSQEPTRAEIQAMYEKGRDQIPDPFSPEPGFKRPLKIAFQYLKADFERFLEAEMAKIDDDQVQAYYEENQQDFRVSEEPATFDPTFDAPDETPEQTPEETPEEMSADDPEESGQASDEPSAEDAEAPELTGPENQPNPEESADPAESSEPSETPAPSEDDQSNRLDLAVDSVFVSLMTDEQPPNEEEPPAEEEAPPAEEMPPADEEAPADEETPVEAVPPVEDDLETQPEGETQPEPTPAEVRYRPLEEVADEIRRTIARPLAQDAMDEAMKSARREVEAYFRASIRARALRDAGRDVPQPAPLDLEALAQKFQLIPGETRLVDQFEIEDYELGKAYRFSFAHGQVQTIPFAQIAYVEGVPLFRPDQIRSFEVDVEFLYWKAEEEQSFVPTLDQAKEDVVTAWKRNEALQLAKAEAERLAQAARPDQSLRETVGEKLADRVFETGPFSWMTRGATPTGMGSPTLSQVPGVEGAGPEFMRSVFRLQPGQTGVAVNEPLNVVFVVRLLDQMPDEDTRRQAFLRSGVTFDTMYMAYSERERLVQDWYEDLQRHYNVQWNRPPQLPHDDW